MRNRRALSTVVGGVFFLVVVMTAASYLTYSMGLLDTFTQTVFVVDQERENKKSEDFEISNLELINNKFNMTIQNSGNIPIKLTRLWVENTTSTDQVYKFDIDLTVSPGSSVTNVGQTQNLAAVTDQTYELKLVTERGNTKEFLVNSSNEPLDLQLFALPDEVPNKFTTTLMLAVTNNSTKNLMLTNLTPVLTPVSLGATATFEGNLPKPKPVLEEGETALFEWTYRIEGNEGQQVRFDASLSNGVSGNTVSREVTINRVDFADQSGGALESNLLAASAQVNDSVLIFHKETTDALDGRQMWSSGPEDNNGEILDLATINPIFYTNFDANVTSTIPAGNWNATLRYISSPMPSSLMHSGNDAEDMAYHFESDLDSPLDTTGNTAMTLGTGSERPIWESKGHQGAGSYQFSGGQYASIPLVASFNKVTQPPDATAGWFKASSTGPASRQVIYYGEDNPGNKYYEISLDSTGRVIFEFDTGSVVTRCTSLSTYKDDSWHHFAALRPAANSCELYIDGIEHDSLSQGGNGSVDLANAIYIGAEDNLGNNGFTGSLDDIIHWNDYVLDEDSQNEVTDLYNTNYGNSAHQITFQIDIVDENGNALVPAKNVLTSVNFPMNFTSDFGEYSSPVSDIWGQFNFTSLVSTIQTVDKSERLKLSMTFVPKLTGNLEMKMVIDDTDVTSGLGNSFLQTPFPDNAYVGYFTYDNSARGTISVFNPSENGNWLTLLSRVVFEDLSTTTAYASFIDASNSQGISDTQDSVFLAPSSTTIVEYERPRTQPGNTASTLIPEGRYKMHVFLSGYDDKGSIFLKSSTIGVVRVI